MLKKLDESATKLAKTERESAWREMAKQVAHEIKNPLTPMKLTTQQLLRAWETQPAEFDQKLRRFGTGMIEQIEALANIANEFSNFAKMPKSIPVPINILTLTQSVVELYQEDVRNRVTFRSYNIPNQVFQLDKDQIIRALNNLITNALQSIPKEKMGQVDVVVRGYRDAVIIRVADNGTGISPDTKQKLFIPNFTTKSNGSGLGLAMVKNIMIQNHGSVECWSRLGYGTSFYLFFRRS